MTKKEKELFLVAFSNVRSARNRLKWDMEEFDCTWPESIITLLDDAIDTLTTMKPKSK